MNAESTFVRPSRPAVVAPGGDGARLAAMVLALPMRVAATPLGRRALAAAAIAVVLVTWVGTLYDHTDRPAAGRRPAVHAAASRDAAPPGRRTEAAAPAAAKRAPGAAAGEAAAAWFAGKQRVAVDRVRALQERRVSATERRVLVIAEAGGAKLPSAYVTVRKGRDGWTAVS
jgi:pyruvate/2-oxoglutarate dehydrogenase complex dihydrolipoamide acyltransferase (E2) component